MTGMIPMTIPILSAGEHEDARHPVAVDTSEHRGLTFSQVKDTQHEEGKQDQDEGGTNKAVLLADGAKDKVGILLRHVLQFRLRSVKDPFPVRPPDRWLSWIAPRGILRHLSLVPFPTVPRYASVDVVVAC